MSDTIYREDAINALYHHFPSMTKDGNPKCPISDSPYCWYCGARMEEGEDDAVN